MAKKYIFLKDWFYKSVNDFIHEGTIVDEYNPMILFAHCPRIEQLCLSEERPSCDDCLIKNNIIKEFV